MTMKIRIYFVTHEISEPAIDMRLFFDPYSADKYMHHLVDRAVQNGWTLKSCRTLTNPYQSAYADLERTTGEGDTEYLMYCVDCVEAQDELTIG